MIFFDAIPDYLECAICRKTEIRYDYDIEEYFLFKYEEGLHAHALCLFQRWAFNALVRIPVHTWKHFLWRIEESNWGMATPFTREKRRQDLALLAAAVKSAGVTS